MRVRYSACLKFAKGKKTRGPARWRARGWERGEKEKGCSELDGGFIPRALPPIPLPWMCVPSSET